MSYKLLAISSCNCDQLVIGPHQWRHEQLIILAARQIKMMPTMLLEQFTKYLTRQ